MAKYSLLPADTYTVVNKTILTENDKTEIANQVYAMFTNGEEVRF